MTDRELKEFNKRLNKIKQLGIYVPKEMTPKSKIRGVYGFFVKVDENYICFYIGRRALRREIAPRFCRY